MLLLLSQGNCVFVRIYDPEIFLFRILQGCKTPSFRATGTPYSFSKRLEIKRISNKTAGVATLNPRSDTPA
jgi:hypothetical protein